MSGNPLTEKQSLFHSFKLYGIYVSYITIILTHICICLKAGLSLHVFVLMVDHFKSKVCLLALFHRWWMKDLGDRQISDLSVFLYPFLLTQCLHLLYVQTQKT